MVGGVARSFDELDRAGVPFFGKWAVAVRAEPRFTKNIDLLIGIDPDNLLGAVAALGMFGAPAHIIDAARSLGPSEFMFFGSPPARIDLLREIPGVQLAQRSRAGSMSCGTGSTFTSSVATTSSPPKKQRATSEI